MKLMTILLCLICPSSIQPNSDNTKPNHTIFDELLRMYVDDDGLVFYKGWKENDAPKLDEYLNTMKEVDPAKLSKKESFAFWINVYNALTIRAMIDFYPLKSIKEKASKFFGYNVWKDYKIKIYGKEYSLDYIEHEILRKMDEPRIHFGLVCASIGCPPLRNRAYTDDKIIDELEENGKRFFKNMKNFRIDANGKTVHLSAIFKWFRNDFGSNESEILKFVSKFLDQDQSKLLSQHSKPPDVEYLEYDWSLNERTSLPTQNEDNRQ